LTWESELSSIANDFLSGKIAHLKVTTKAEVTTMAERLHTEAELTPEEK
jgi:hypothetical protein